MKLILESSKQSKIDVDIETSEVISGNFVRYLYESEDGDFLYFLTEKDGEFYWDFVVVSSQSKYLPTPYGVAQMLGSVEKAEQAIDDWLKENSDKLRWGSHERRG